MKKKENQKKIEWTDVWKFPLWYDDCGYAWSKDEKGELTMALTFEDDFVRDENDDWYDSGRNKHLMDIINEECSNDTDRKWTAKGCDVFDDGEYVFCARGWGHLTGVLKLSSKEACEVQDGFIAYILDKLNK